MAEKQVIQEFRINPGEPTSQLSKINIVGKKIEHLRLLDGDRPYFDYYNHIPPQACYLKAEAVLCICFNDGDVLELYGWDEGFDISYNFYSDNPEFEESQPDLLFNSVINKYISGQTVVSSTFCGKEVGFKGYIPIMTFYPTIELENGIVLRFEATFDNTLDIALFKNSEDLHKDKYLKGSFNREELIQLCKVQNKRQFRENKGNLEKRI